MEPIHVKLKIWDTAGGEQFRSLGKLYYKEAAAVFIVYDCTNATSFSAVQYWLNELKEYEENSCVYIIANKSDDVDNEDM